jgi:hypothetical protein
MPVIASHPGDDLESKAGDDQIGVVEGGAEGMAERVAQFATFVDGTGGGRGDMAGNPAGKGELLEELFRPASSWVISG